MLCLVPTTLEQLSCLRGLLNRIAKPRTERSKQSYYNINLSIVNGLEFRPFGTQSHLHFFPEVWPRQLV